MAEAYLEVPVEGLRPFLAWVSSVLATLLSSEKFKDVRADGRLVYGRETWDLMERLALREIYKQGADLCFGGSKVVELLEHTLETCDPQGDLL